MLPGPPKKGRAVPLSKGAAPWLLALCGFCKLRRKMRKVGHHGPVCRGMVVNPNNGFKNSYTYMFYEFDPM